MIHIKQMCPFTRGSKFGSQECYGERCAWWREDAGKCAVVSIAEIFAPIPTFDSERFGGAEPPDDYNWELDFDRTREENE